MALTVTVDKESEHVIDRLVNDGRYLDAADVVRAALRMVEDRERAREEKLVQLRAEIQEGFDSGPGQQVDPDTWGEEIKARGMAKLLATQNGQ